MGFKRKTKAAAVTIEAPAKPAATKAVARLKPRAAPNAEPVANDAVGVLTILERLARDPNVGVDKLGQMIALQEKVLDRNAKAAFDATLSLIQQELPVIERNGRIVIRKKDAAGERTGPVQQDTPYALYEDIVEAVAPVLGRHGFALRFETDLDPTRGLHIVGILSGCGHRERTEFHLQYDTSGSKNNIQAIGSSVAYGKRMAACALLNIVSRGEDDDGKASGAPVVVGDPLSADQLETLCLKLEAVGAPTGQFLKHVNDSRPKGHPTVKDLKDIPAARFNWALDSLSDYEAKKAAAAKKKAAAQAGADTNAG